MQLSPGFLRVEAAAAGAGGSAHPQGLGGACCLGRSLPWTNKAEVQALLGGILFASRTCKALPEESPTCTRPQGTALCIVHGTERYETAARACTPDFCPEAAILLHTLCHPHCPKLSPPNPHPSCFYQRVLSKRQT